MWLLGLAELNKRHLKKVGKLLVANKDVHVQVKIGAKLSIFKRLGVVPKGDLLLVDISSSYSLQFIIDSRTSP